MSESKIIEQEITIPDDKNYTEEQMLDKGMYLSTRGDYEEALTLYREFAEQGYASAQYILGELYEDGKGGVSQDWEKAAYWYTKAAKQGHIVAQNNLGTLYYNGTGVFRNKTKAHWLHRQAAAQGDDVALRNLGRLNYADTFLRVYSILGVILFGGISWALFDDIGLVGLAGGAIAGWIVGWKIGQMIRRK